MSALIARCVARGLVILLETCCLGGVFDLLFRFVLFYVSGLTFVVLPLFFGSFCVF